MLPSGRLVYRRRRPARRSSAEPILVFLALTVTFLGWRWWFAPTRHGPAPPAQAAGSGPELGSASGRVSPPPDGAAATVQEAAHAPAGANAAVALSPAPAVPAAYQDPALQALVESTIDEDNGAAAVVVRNLRTGASAAIRERDVYPSASLAKLPILFETYRRLADGSVHPDEQIAITADAITGGAGVLQAREGEKLTVAELLDLAVEVSDNVAARLLLQRVGGVDAVNQTLAGLGLTQTRLYADDRPNTTSAAETATLLAWIATNRLGPGAPGGSAATAAIPPAPLPNTLSWLLAHPQAQAWLTPGVPSAVPVAHKSGQLPSVRHDAGIVYARRGPYVVVALTDDLADQDDAEQFITDLSRRVYDYFAR